MTEAQSGVVDKRGFLFGRIPGRATYGPKERPKIFIRTTSQQAATMAIAANMAADSVEFGDIFSTSADVIVSPANSVGHMNGGVDLRIRDKFGKSRLEERVRETIVERFEGALPIGRTFTIRTHSPGVPLLAGDPEWLIVSPTMTQPRQMNAKQLRDAAYVATLAALVTARDIGASGVTLTTMGAGVGAGSHTERGARISGIEAAIAGLARGLSDFQDVADGLVSREQALADYRNER